QRGRSLPSKSLQSCFAKCVDTDVAVRGHISILAPEGNIGPTEVQGIVLKIADHLYIIGIVSVHPFGDGMPERHDVDMLSVILAKYFDHTMDICLTEKRFISLNIENNVRFKLGSKFGDPVRTAGVFPTAS